MDQPAYKQAFFIVLIGALGGLGAPEGAAQDTLAVAQGERASLREHMKAGIEACKAEQWSAAEQALRIVVAEDDEYQLDGSPRTAVYWLGRVYEAMDQSEQARALWRAGVQAGLDRETLPIHAADAYVRSVFADTVDAQYGEAAQLYRMLIEAVADDLHAEEQAVVERHLAQLRLLLPDTLRAHIDADGHVTGAERRFQEELLTWWRSQDPRPATPRNERIVEHLRRVAHASARFENDRHATTFDARGRIYVKYGVPTKTKEIDFNQRDLIDRIQALRRAMGNNLVVSPASFSDNAFWLYERSDEPYYFLFVKEGGTFEIGGIMDLIPKRLRTGMDPSTGRGGAKIDVVLEALRLIYRQLSVYHIDYGPRYADIADYVGRLEEARMRSEGERGRSFYTADKRSDHSALVRERGLATAMSELPGQFARHVVEEAKHDHRRNEKRQQERIPHQQTTALADVDPLPVVTRTARFLEADGTTRADVYWALAPDESGALAEVLRREGQTLVDVIVNHVDEQYRTVDRHRKQFMLSQVQQDVLIPNQPLTVQGITDAFHLAMEWDQYTLRREEGGTVSADRHVRASVARSDSSMSPLRADSGTLEMSDLVPVVVDESEGLTTDSDERFAGQPYPLSQLVPDIPLALYFEVYHLTYGANEQTRYTIDYQIERRAERGGLAGLFRGDDEQQTTTQTTQKGTRRRTEEYLMLDLGDWSGKEDLTITVRVTDEHTGQTVERSVEFSAP